jgi:curved DNA-binding protein CbpA
MGNDQSIPVERTYNDYITQQQRLIQAQQEQINRLSRMNLRQNILNQQQIPSNIMLQKQHQVDTSTNLPVSQYKQPISYQQPQISYQQSGLKPKKEKLNPYKILMIDKNFDENTLKKAYLRMAMKTHPDKGGSQEQFQQVSIAYTVLLKRFKDMNNNHSHNDLRDQSKSYMGDQEQDALKNVNLSEKFDGDLFNKIYEENRIDGVYDNGYGSWMNKNPIEERSQEKMFNGNFNKNMFHREFEKHKKQQQKNMGSQLIKYDEPQVNISYKGKDSIMELGKEKVDDFSGEAGDLNYRDYKDAYTNTCLIDINSVGIRGRVRNINDMEAQRTNISYHMNDEDQQRYAIRKQMDEQEEQHRIQRIQTTDQKTFNSYDRIHQRMLGL